MDPRLKLDFYKADENSSAEDPEEIRSYIKQFYSRDYAALDDSVIQTPSPKKRRLLKSFYKKSGKADTQSELDVYLSEPVVDDHSNFNVLEYWKVNSYRFPNLSRMARD